MRDPCNRRLVKVTIDALVRGNTTTSRRKLNLAQLCQRRLQPPVHHIFRPIPPLRWQRRARLVNAVEDAVERELQRAGQVSAADRDDAVADRFAVTRECLG